MPSLLEFTLLLYRRRALLVSALVLSPTLVFLALFGIFEIITNLPFPLRMPAAMKLPSLPACDQSFYCTENTIYLAYSPNTQETQELVKLIINNSNLSTSNTRTVGFDSSDQMIKNMSLLGLGPDPAKFISSINVQTIMREHLQYGNKTLYDEIDPNTHILDIPSAQQMISTIYGINYDDYRPAYDYALNTYHNIFLALDFSISQQTISTPTGKSIPSSISYVLYYNQTMLSRYVYQTKDNITFSIGDLWNPNFWTTLSYTVNRLVDGAILKYYRGMDYTYDLAMYVKRSDTTVYLINRTYCFMGIALGLNLILSTVVAGTFRGRTHTSLRRLGVKEIHLLCTNALCLLVLNLISMIVFCSLNFLIKAYPFAEFEYPVVIVFAIIFALGNTGFALLLAYLFYSPALSLVLSAFSVLCFVIIPFLILSHSDTKVSLWQPIVVPKEVTWIFIVLIPLFCSFSLVDMLLMMTEGGFNYSFNSLDYTKIPISFITSDWNNYHSTLRICISSTSSSDCVFQFPMVWWLVLVSLLQSLVVIPLLLLLLTHSKPEFSWRGIPWYFLVSKRFWAVQKDHRRNQSKLLLEVESCKTTLEIRGLRKTYKTCRRQNTTLRDFSFTLHKKEILGLVAASGGGKSTLLNILSGELKFESTSDDLEDSMQKPVFKVLERYDLRSPYDAYYLKPNIGYCPQDRTNVWMAMSVYENVYYSTIFRSKSLGTYDSKILGVHGSVDNYVQFLLRKIHLSSSSVQTRLAKDLSGGMLRRLALANATAGYPAIFFFDEITSGVDPLLKRQIWAFVKDLVELGDASAILTTHDAGEVAELSTNVLIFRDGKTIHASTPLELCRRHGDYTLSLIFGDLSLLSELPEFTANKAVDLLRRTLINITPNSTSSGSLDEIRIVSVFPHVIKISIPSIFLDHSSLVIPITQGIELFCKDCGIDYMLSKASLDDVFVKLVDNKPSEITSQTCGPQVSAAMHKKIVRPIRPNPLKYMFYKNWLADCREYFVKFIGVLVVNVAATALVVSMLSNSVKTITESAAQLFRPLTATYAEGCISACRSTAGNKPLKEVIETCFSDRSSALFAPFYQYMGSLPVCQSYAKFLGLDIANTSYYVLGDGAYIQPQQGLDSSIADWAYLGVITEEAPPTWLGKMVGSAGYPHLGGVELRSLKTDTGPGDDFTLLLSKMKLPQEWIIPLSTYDTITPFYGLNSVMEFRTPATDEDNVFSYYFPKTILSVARYECLIPSGSEYKVLASGDCPSDTQAKSCIYRDEGIVYFSTVRSMMREFYDGQAKTVNYADQTEALNVSKRISIVRDAFMRMPTAVIAIHSSSAPNALSFTLYGPLPPMGTQNRGFSNTYINLRFNNTNHRANMPAFPYFGGVGALGYNMLQNPLRIDPSLAVPMLDQVVRFVGSIFRRDIMKAELGRGTSYDQALTVAYSFTYTAKVQVMPYFSNPRFAFPSDHIMLLRQMELLTSYVMPFVFLVPMIIVGIRVAREIEDRLLRVFLLHNISKHLFLGSHILYYTLWSFVASFLCILILSVSIPAFLWSNPPTTILCLLFLYLLASFNCTTYSILIALLVKQVRLAILLISIVVFINIIYCSIIKMNEPISLALSLVLPSLGVFWELTYTVSFGFINVGPIITCVAIFLVHLGFCFVAIYFIDGCATCTACKSSSTVHKQDVQDPRIYTSFTTLPDTFASVSTMHTSTFLERSADDFALTRTPMQSVFSTLSTYSLNESTAKRAHLDIKNVFHKYPSGNVAIKDISFSIADGEVFALLGGNGAGKSTLMHALTGLHVPTRGTAMCIRNDKDSHKVNLFNPTTRHGELLTIIPQDDLLYPEFTVLDHMIIMAGITSKNLRPNIKSIHVVLQTVELYDHMHKRARELSGGMQRRLTLAMVIVSSPSLVCLDEITTGLSSRMKTDIWKAIIASRGVCRTMMLTTHDMQEVEALADRCCIMKSGEIVALGTMAEICSRSKVKFSVTVALQPSSSAIEPVHSLLTGIELASLASCYTEKIYATPSGACLIGHTLSESTGCVTYMFGANSLLADVLLDLDRIEILSSHYWTIESCRFEQAFMDLIEE
ncbi:putative ABC transporter, ATP-binding protein [Giardia duodenalis]|uniref:ABC transporter, ATP-binding protein n=1 Tax=Giardia intestinalis (strain ATCC 50803 / WB clone C6) TaxID=184922 RepID=A8B6C9_GIAIC|nr:putative ABC transporter, ATP-binding protein [Giardia intestinalis]KAE8304990.1 putative ABC transporter, ATP-binding protein [Giardia intestinalis]|eukprot:XP_001709441.1 ABC transporter, ATP-binding protein, putative [Giardia lamblia ATCC 50803]